MSHITTSYKLTIERGTHYSVSHHHIVRPDDRERYTLQCLTAPRLKPEDREREVHSTESYGTMSYDWRPERGTQYSVSQHHVLQPEDRERYTVQCLTAPRTTTGGQREVHSTVSHSTTSYDRGTEAICIFNWPEVGGAAPENSPRRS